MIEIPSAAIACDTLVSECSFFSIGSNDLIQYLMAVDRLNDRVAHLYEPTHPALIRMLDMIVKAANKGCGIDDLRRNGGRSDIGSPPGWIGNRVVEYVAWLAATR